MQPFLDWLIGEAGAGWIIGLLGLLGALYAWLNRDRAPRVIIQEVGRVRLLDIHPSQRERLSVFYTDTQGTQESVQTLEQKKIVIYNNGTKDISEPVRFALGFHGEDSQEEFEGFWRLIFDDIECASEPMFDDAQDVCIGARVGIPYLNSYPAHGHYVTAYLISDREIKIELSEGIGKGWSAYFVPLCRLEEIQGRVTVIFSRITNALILLTAGMFVLAVAQLLSNPNPLTRVFLNPTPDKIEAALRQQRDLFEALRTSGLLGYYRAYLQTSGALPTIFIIIIGLMLLSGVLSSLKEKTGELISRKFLGTQPASKFER